MMELVTVSPVGLVLNVLSLAARTIAWVKVGVIMEFADALQDSLVLIVP